MDGICEKLWFLVEVPPRKEMCMAKLMVLELELLERFQNIDL